MFRKDFITMWYDVRVVSSSGKEEEEGICSSSGVEVVSGLEEEETCIYKASCEVVESGRLGWGHGEGRCELGVGESGRLGGGVGRGVCGKVEEGKGICMAS